MITHGGRRDHHSIVDAGARADDGNRAGETVRCSTSPHETGATKMPIVVTMPRRPAGASS